MPFLSDVYTTLHHEMHTLLAQFPPRCEVCLEPGDQLGPVDQSTCPAFQGAPLLSSFQRAARPDVFVRKILDTDGSDCAQPFRIRRTLVGRTDTKIGHPR